MNLIGCGSELMSINFLLFKQPFSTTPQKGFESKQLQNLKRFWKIFSLQFSKTTSQRSLQSFWKTQYIDCKRYLTFKDCEYLKTIKKIFKKIFILCSYHNNIHSLARNNNAMVRWIYSAKLCEKKYLRTDLRSIWSKNSYGYFKYQRCY